MGAGRSAAPHGGRAGGSGAGAGAEPRSRRGPGCFRAVGTASCWGRPGVAVEGLPPAGARCCAESRGEWEAEEGLPDPEPAPESPDLARFLHLCSPLMARVMGPDPLGAELQETSESLLPKLHQHIRAGRG